MPSSSPSGQERLPSIDVSVPHSARVWNYWLGGKDHYPVDREVGDRVRSVLPGIVDLARGERGFLVRAVQYLAGEAGMRQFLDIGTGLPTASNTHEVAQSAAPECRIVYVDNDPLVLAHARALLASSPQGATDYLDADLRDPDTILRDATRTLDFAQPIVLMLLGIMHHIMDTGEAYAIVNRFLDALPVGSYLVLAHPTADIDPETMITSMRIWNESGGTPPITPRSRHEIIRFFDGLEVLEPGIVSPTLWRPDPVEAGTVSEVGQFCGVGRKITADTGVGGPA